ncbi:hypothetical protein TNCV_2608871 [Trichonephila clavipes]|uniref:Uncharacterized protein n=1 Tax=Trichonephila clavipes TaxID=2585209 RepID=A0A8X6VBS6_TRICX|nr:hypothetical protein TNCV_2608871 [Trichonephila clavipes]
MGKKGGNRIPPIFHQKELVTRPPIGKACVSHVGSAAEGNARWRYCGVSFCLKNKVFLPSTQRWRRFEFRKPRQRERKGGEGKGPPDSAADPHTCVHSCRPFHACMHP